MVLRANQRVPQAGQSSPSGAARHALERPSDIGGDPAAVEPAGLRDIRLAVEEAAIEPGSVKRDVVAHRDKGGTRLGVAPAEVEQLVADRQMPIDGDAFHSQKELRDDGCNSPAAMLSGGKYQLGGRLVSSTRNAASVSATTTPWCSIRTLRELGCATAGRG